MIASITDEVPAVNPIRESIEKKFSPCALLNQRNQPVASRAGSPIKKITTRRKLNSLRRSGAYMK
jgi:hypothetical protein